MCTDRRDFLRLSTRLAGLRGQLLSGAAPVFGAHEDADANDAIASASQQRELPEPIRKLRKMTDGIVPISLERAPRDELKRRGG